MKKIKKLLTGICVVCFMILLSSLSLGEVKAEGKMMPTPKDNTSIGLKSTSELVPTNNGYMRVYYTGENIGIEYYDDAFNIIEKRMLAMELSMWGGFYAGSDGYYYIVEGQTNVEENDAAEVIRVIKYDAAWNKKGTAKITSNSVEIRFPFANGCVEMAEHNGTLYIVTGHEGYVDPMYYQGHQGFLMIAVDKATMTGKIVDSDLWHSLSQYIEADASDVYVLEKSEGSRYTKLSKYDSSTLRSTSIPVFKYGGIRESAWAIPCYASVDDMALSANNVLGLGTSIDQSKYDKASKGENIDHNIYLTVTPKKNFTESGTTVKWLTNYSGGGKSFMGTKITKINDDRFLVSWEEYGEARKADTDDTLSTSILHYVFINGAGDKISQEFTAAAMISNCHPIVKGSNIVYYASNANMVDFYSINVQTGAFNKKKHRIAGKNATWDLKDGVLRISGTGMMDIDTDEKQRYPVSSIGSRFTDSFIETPWESIRDEVKKIVIDTGITSICESAFEYFDNLTEVEIKPGLKSIEERAFYGCYYLRKITIPSSVTSISEDCLWTGNFNGDVIDVVIYAPADSYAAKYAKDNGIAFKPVEEGGHSSKRTVTKATLTENGKVIDKCSVCGKVLSSETIYAPKTFRLSTTHYTYDGSIKKPTVTVKDNRGNTISSKNYTVTYSSGRKNIGRYYAKVTFKGNYTGSKTVYFEIGPKNPSTVSATLYGYDDVKVSWSKVSGATGYKVYYKKSTSSSYTYLGRTSRMYTYKKNLTDGAKYYFKVVAYKTINDNRCENAGKTDYIYTLKKVSTPRLSKSGTKVKVRWTNISGESGYQISKSTSKTGTNIVSTYNTSSGTYKYVSATKGKYYYYKVRAYKTVGGKKIYGPWSTAVRYRR